MGRLRMASEDCRRGDVWLADFGSDPTDPEKAFFRPAIIVSDNRLHHPRLQMVIVIPGTSTIRQLPLHLVVEPDSENGLDTRTAFQVEQVRAISTRLLVDHLGRLDAPSQQQLDQILRNALDL